MAQELDDAALWFEWDGEKARATTLNQSLSFDEADSTFEDPPSLTIPDPVHSEDEDRFTLIGRSVEGKLLTAVHTDGGERVRIISARCASAKEACFCAERG